MKKFDSQFRSATIKHLAGVDEAGRGPLAGPVVAAAVIFPIEVEIPGINDSKKLSEKKREELYVKIIETAAAYEIGIIEHDEIDRINILQASLKAMKIAVDNLFVKPDLVLIDGNKSFISTIPTKTIVKGDSKSMSIAAASILAKVTRDRIMKKLAVDFPEYSWEQNKGYPTKAHISSIREHGVSVFHRISFLNKIIDTQQELKFK